MSHTCLVIFMINNCVILRACVGKNATHMPRDNYATIEAWSKNTSTCPIDRLNFEQIFVDRSYTNRERVRVIETVKEKEKVIEESEEDNFCPICHQADREEVMLLCDYCNQGYHMDCLTPALLEIPEGEWFCQNCDDGSLEDRNLHSPNIEDIFAELDDELGMLVSRVSEVRVPRIARTLANERIRIRILNGINRTTTNTRRRRVTRRRRRRRQSARTFVVECEINEFDEKFALKTTKKIIRRRRRRRVNSNRRNDSARQTVRTRFAEQLGMPPRGGQRDLGGNTALSIFGNPNALEYFSDDEETTNIEQGTMEIGAGGAVQTRVRLANYMRGNSVERKNLLLGRRRPRTPPPTVGPVDLLGSIMSLQDRWHNAAQRIQDVRINQDGTLELPATKSTATTTTSTVESNQQSPAIMEAPMYQRGGHNNFNRGGGGGARGNMAGGYNNRFGSNYGNNNNQYRNSNAGNLGNSAEGGGNTDDGDYNMNRGNFFPTAISHRGPQQQNTPFNIRFNQRNQQQQQNNNNNTQQRHSLPFATPRQPNYNYNNSQIRIQPLFRQQEQNNNNRMMPDLFGGLPPPTTASAPPSQQQANNFPHISVPPPPTPPVGASFPWGPPTVAPASVFGPVRRTENNHDDAEHNNSECPNYAVYSTFSKENLQAEGEKNEHKNELENEINQEDDEKEEDLVQLDDDEEDAVNDGGNLANENIPLPPNETHAIDNNNLYEPENPTEEDDDIEESTHHENADEEDDEEEQQEIEENAQHEEENINKSDEEMDDEEAQTIELGTSACKTADDGDDDDNGDGDDSSDSESDTEKQNKTSENAADKNANISPTNNQNDIEKKTTNNRKGVLELYDDSDWEELDIDKPQESAIVTTTTTTNDIQNAIIEPQVDRSFTPCLDEPVENEIENLSLDEPVSVVAANVANIVPPDTNALGTELISEEELHTKPANKKMGSKSKSRSKSRAKSRGRRRSRSRSRSMRRSSAERFKKISRRQKERNYRGISDQKQSKRGGARNERTRSIATRSRSRTRSPIRFRTRSRSRSLRRQQLRRTRSRTRSRSPILRHRFSRSPRKRTRSRSLNRRGRVLRSRSRPLRSRSRSRSMHNNKENNRHKNNSNSKRDEDKSSRNNTSNRPKRRELPRYDVRNVIGNQNQRLPKDRYGRDTLRPQSRSVSRNRQFIHARSFSRTPRSRTPSPQRPQRIRRASFSMSPTPSPPPQHYNQHGGNISPLPHYQSPTGRARYLSPSPITARLNGRRNLPREQSHSPAARATHMQRSRTPSMLRISEANNISLRKSRSLSVRAERMRNRRKRSKERKKKRSEKKARGNSLIRAPSPDEQNFEIEKVAKKKRRHSTLNKHWSPTSPETANVATHEALGWTPPPREDEHILTAVRRSISVENTTDFDKHKRQKKKHKTKDKRKEKRRKARTASNEPPPSKEVFASGNNILVSVSFNKDKNTTANAGNVNNMPQSTVVTLPSHREDIRGQRRRRSDDNGKKQHGEEHNGASKKRDKTHKRRTKTDAKPVAIIDLERSPFQVQQDLMDVIVLTDSEDANEKDTAKSQRRQSLMSTSADGEEEQQQQQKTADNNEALESMDEETSTNVLTTGPKTPPEPHLVKFNIQNKKTLNARSVLHDDVSDATSDDEQTQCREEVQHRESVATPLNEQTTNANKMAASDNMSDSVVSVSQKIGPNTPPESAPCSPDVYDPFDPTKSPSISPSSPTPSNSAQTTLNDISTDNVSTANVDLNKNVEQQQQLVSSTNSGVPSHITNTAATQTSLNAADLVLAFINNKNSNTNNEATLIPGVGDDVISNSNKHETANDIVSGGLQVLSNVLLRSPVGPTILGLGNKLTQLPALGGSVGSSSSGILATAQNISNNNNNTSSNLDDSFNIADFDSPYSPGSADYEDLFEPPPDSTKQRAAAGNTVKRGKADVFDNLFGSSSPPPRQSIPNVFLTSTQRKPGNLPGRSKNNKSKDHKSYDDVPSSAVDLNIKDKLLRKLNRQERVVEEVKLILKPRFNKKQISKEDYKEIMRRAVPKICHSKSGEINPRKIKNLIEAYVKKFRAKHKKLNLLNTGQVSSAVKCAAYLKKL